MEENRIKIWIHKIKDTAVVLLHFLAVCSPLSLVCVTTPELLAGETIGQWVWFGKAVLFSAGCIVAACLLQLFDGSSRKKMLSFSCFSACVSWSLILLGGIEAVWGLRQLYGFFLLPVIFVMHLPVLFLIPVRMPDIWQWYYLSACIIICNSGHGSG